MKPMHDNNLLRLNEVLSIVPVSRSSWYAGMKSDQYPASVRVSARHVAWRASDIGKLVASGVQQ